MLNFEFRGAAAKLTPLPGCPRVLVVHAAHIPQILRGHGLAHEAHRDLLASVDSREYGLLLATVNDSNTAAIRTLSRGSEWQILTLFTNPRTGERIRLYGRRIS